MRVSRPSERPIVTLSWAQGIDGSIAAAPGISTPLSGPESMKMTHSLRARHEGILVGIGTLLADNPSLGVRLVEGRSPRPVVLDGELRTPPESKLLAEGERKPIIIGARLDGPKKDEVPDRRRSLRRQAEAARRLEEAGALVILVDLDERGWLDLEQTLAALHDEGIGSLMVEGGARVLASFLAARLVDNIVVTIAPTILGGLAPFAMVSGSTWLPCSLSDSKAEVLGADVVISGRPLWPQAPFAGRLE